MAHLSKKQLESKYNEAQGTLETRLTKGGLKVTTRQIAKVLASHLPYNEILRSEAKAKTIVDSIQQIDTVKLGSIASVYASLLDRQSDTEALDFGELEQMAEVTVLAHTQESKPPKRKRPKLSQFRVNVDWLVQEIDRLPQEVKTSLACAYVFSSRVPRQDREDILQELTANLLQFTRDKSWTVGIDGSGLVSIMWTGYTLSESLAYRIAKCDTLDYWRKIKGQSQSDSLDSISEGSEESPDILDYSQEDFTEAIEKMDFNRHTTEVLKVEKLLHDSQIAEKTRYTSEASRRKELKEVYYNLRDTVEYENQVIGKLDTKRTLAQLPKAIRKLVTRLTDKLDENGNNIVKRTSVLSSAEYKALQRFANSPKGQELKQSLLASLQS